MWSRVESLMPRDVLWFEPALTGVWFPLFCTGVQHPRNSAGLMFCAVASALRTAKAVEGQFFFPRPASDLRCSSGGRRSSFNFIPCISLFLGFLLSLGLLHTLRTELQPAVDHTPPNDLDEHRLRHRGRQRRQMSPDECPLSGTRCCCAGKAILPRHPISHSFSHWYPPRATPTPHSHLVPFPYRRFHMRRPIQHEGWQDPHEPARTCETLSSRLRKGSEGGHSVQLTLVVSPLVEPSFVVHYPFFFRKAQTRQSLRRASTQSDTTDH